MGESRYKPCRECFRQCSGDWHIGPGSPDRLFPRPRGAKPPVLHPEALKNHLAGAILPILHLAAPKNLLSGAKSTILHRKKKIPEGRLQARAGREERCDDREAPADKRSDGRNPLGVQGDKPSKTL